MKHAVGLSWYVFGALMGELGLGICFVHVAMDCFGACVCGGRSMGGLNPLDHLHFYLDEAWDVF